MVTDTKRQSVAMEKKKQAFAEVNKNMQSSAKEKLARKLTEKKAPAEEKKSPAAEKQQSSPTAIQYELHTKNSGYQLPMPLFALNVSKFVAIYCKQIMTPVIVLASVWLNTDDAG